MVKILYEIFDSAMRSRKVYVTSQNSYNISHAKDSLTIIMQIMKRYLRVIINRRGAQMTVVRTSNSTQNIVKAGYRNYHKRLH